MATIRVEVIEDGVTLGLSQLRRRFPDVIDAAAAAAAKRISNDAKRSILSGTRSGRTYKRKSVLHIASAPGEPPASDTGNLLNHIFPESGRGYALVGATVLHGLYLEERAPTKGGRPWLLPALDRDLDKIEDDLVRRLQAI